MNTPSEDSKPATEPAKLEPSHAYAVRQGEKE
jgi:hypothetical protein